MKIETKYKIGDKVWVSVNGKPTQGKVRGINIRTGKLGDKIYSRISYEVISYELPYIEDAVFHTKEELLRNQRHDAKYAKCAN